LNGFKGFRVPALLIYLLTYISMLHRERKLVKTPLLFCNVVATPDNRRNFKGLAGVSAKAPWFPAAEKKKIPLDMSGMGTRLGTSVKLSSWQTAQAGAFVAILQEQSRQTALPEAAVKTSIAFLLPDRVFGMLPNQYPP
jgi:hypothetical protein